MPTPAFLGKSTSQWLDIVRQHARTQTKVAALGGAGQDVNFEQAFSNLAHAYLRDRAPSLLDHEVGFQLIDRNDDSTKAVGVVGFKIGSNWVYAPVFFLNGDLKGNELLYLKNQDMFVPLKENWINYILNRKPNILGEGTDKDYRKGVLPPDLDQMSQSPSKYANDRTWSAAIKSTLPALAAAATYDVKQGMRVLNQSFDLLDFLKQANLQTIDLFVNTCRSCPQLTEDIERFYDTDKVVNTIKEAKYRQRLKLAGTILDEPKPSTIRGCILDDARMHPIKSGSLKILTYGQAAGFPLGLSQPERETLLRDRLLIKDAREEDEVSMPYHVRLEETLSNPTETGIYDVLTKAGDFERCLVVLGPYGPDRRGQFATVIRIDGEKNWCNMPSSQIWVGTEADPLELQKWIKELSDSQSLSKGYSQYIAIAPNGDITYPFRVDTAYGEEGNDVSVYEVDFDTSSSVGMMYSSERHTRIESDPLAYDRWTDGQRLHVNGKKGSGIRVSRGDVFLPEGVKIVEVRHASEDDDNDDNSCGPRVCGQSQVTPIRPGNILDAQLAIMSKTAALSVYNDGAEVELNQQRMSPLDGLISLVRDHGFREPVARELLKQAHVKRKITVRVKYASPYLTDSPVNGPAIPEQQQGGGEFMGYPGPSNIGQDSRVPMDRPPTDPQIYNPNTTLDRNEVGKIRRAANTGQKEIFDTAMVGTMLRSVRDDTMVDQYMGPLAKGMDSLGRILFMFYWHGDEFADRYGKSDMPELEDSLRNSFEAVGDVLQFLKKKTIEPYPEENDVSTDLGAVANS
jgi:hypothetical protein